METSFATSRMLLPQCCIYFERRTYVTRISHVNVLCNFTVVTEIFNKLWPSDFCRTVSLEGLICQLLIKTPIIIRWSNSFAAGQLEVELPSDYYEARDLSSSPFVSSSWERRISRLKSLIEKNGTWTIRCLACKGNRSSRGEIKSSFSRSPWEIPSQPRAAKSLAKQKARLPSSRKSVERENRSRRSRQRNSTNFLPLFMLSNAHNQLTLLERRENQSNDPWTL